MDGVESGGAGARLQLLLPQQTASPSVQDGDLQDRGARGWKRVDMGEEGLMMKMTMMMTHLSGVSDIIIFNFNHEIKNFVSVEMTEGRKTGGGEERQRERSIKRELDSDRYRYIDIDRLSNPPVELLLNLHRCFKESPSTSATSLLETTSRSEESSQSLVLSKRLASDLQMET